MSSQLFRAPKAKTKQHESHHSMTQFSMTQFDSVLQEVSQVLSPVWPLKDYVAVNPYFGLANRTFMSARSYLQVFSKCETLMPFQYFAEQFRSGALAQQDIEEALTEVDWPSTIPSTSATELIELLSSNGAIASPTSSSEPAMQTIAAQASVGNKSHWHEIVVDEISKYCAAHFDEDQASWGSNYKHLSLYQAWHEIAQIDRNAEVLGITGMRALVASLPTDPKEAVVDLLCRLQVPYPLWSTVLLSHVYAVPGWFAWAKYQDQWSNQASPDAPYKTLSSLLAISLAYDLAISKSQDIQIEWSSYLRNGQASFTCENGAALREAWIRYVLLRATEIRQRRRLLESLPQKSSLQSSKLAHAARAQMVFCIDVRSERIRRHIETASSEVQTFGFAGFFGAAFEYVSLGESKATAQLPVLLKPQFCVHEHLPHASEASQTAILSRRTNIRSWRKLWQGFKSRSITSFGFVESSGLLAGFHIVKKTLGLNTSDKHAQDGLRSKQDRLMPSVCATKDLPSSQQIEIAAKTLRNLGLTNGYARLVVFCGHHSQTHNNPLAAGLDCGACGGHSGAPNARWLARLLNQTDVRLGLCEQGIVIPADTVFVAAVHNTTTDQIEFFDQEDVPQSHRQDLNDLQKTCEEASGHAAFERLPQVDGKQKSDLVRKALDWSEVRPEWGLAGNHAFFVGPRALTQHIDLNGQVFLHSYEASQDPNGTVLETIMTAPMIVANWINMQYYASTVDNLNFGSGNKTIHNVVGKFGILAGNSGDLKTGLPLQSIHDGTDYRHQPLRLQVIICAKRSEIERIYRKHELVFNLVNNEWLHLVAIEESGHYRLCPTGVWQELNTVHKNLLPTQAGQESLNGLGSSFEMDGFC